ncbi:MAG: bifunctional diaminohydroxyphosphoribosylaminopyrimidine deaminase/5-amino-6-(5-phosphoribosylamino)uracil reductase RibD [Flavobacteriales bacterium]|nr:bifunctional diaminohydroxyphosphoribosylaminopyrimidine deaminase/5-amino-6-(5-phosphoribosylamino)uracil reductase RibD [Flavobacteriales bacterium]MCB9363009.1 bifunctional diaminohydroxyphosphoribosylaminopyrimidine deaminase/5-amino-6-(5-phosphoribosylamino)uracil reductase RibD [Flavobacteriales bacterium]
MNMDKIYMQRCLLLAKKGLGSVAPNPMVGCVIVHQNKIIGEGYTSPYGGNHAEVNAIQSVKNKAFLKESTLYVSLEPCAHFGKTPPCANLIVEHNIPKVIIGCIDTFSEVSGKGIEKLKNASIDVSLGLLEKECLELNKRFFTFHNKRRPYIILKWAETIDGFIDVDRPIIPSCHPELVEGTTKHSKIAEQARNDDKIDNWITTPLSKKLVHKWRSEESAIMIATNTALNDNPKLNVREWAGKNPLRVVLDINNRLPQHLNILDNSLSTLVFTSVNKENQDNIEYCIIDSSKNIVNQILENLYTRNIQSIIIEGGKQLLQSFIDNNTWDEARVFVGKKQFTKGLVAPTLNKSPKFKQNISTDILSIYYND